MRSKFFGIGSLALLQVAVVGNLQVLPANAVYGAALPFLYLIAVCGFYMPCVLMVAELATSYPQTGGAYIWGEKAFGIKAGFFAGCIFWISNLLWYPSIFSLIAVNIAYLLKPALSQNKGFILSINICMFWTLTVLNCFGVKFSSRVNEICCVLGIIVPMIIIVLLGAHWLVDGNTAAINLDRLFSFTDVFHLNNLGLLIAIVISLFGIELSAVHAGNVSNPKKDYPLSLLVSSVALLVLLLLSELAIAIIIPESKLSVETGFLDAITTFFNQVHLNNFLSLVLLLILIGNLGSVAAWMLGSTRGMYVACKRNNLTPFLQKVNRFEAPIGVLVFEAVIFSIASSIFLLFPAITDSFWLLLDLASQITLVYYIILFISAVRLRFLPKQEQGFSVPGGKIVFISVMTLGALTSLITFFIGFIAPDDLNFIQAQKFHLVMLAGLAAAFIFPFILLVLAKKKANL